MKKSSKPLIVLFASMLVIVTLILLISQGLRFKYEEQQRESAELVNRIKTEKSILANLQANFQMLSAEDMIKKYAADELGLVEADSNSDDKITLDIENLNRLAELIEETYE